MRDACIQDWGIGEWKLECTLSGKENVVVKRGSGMTENRSLQDELKLIVLQILLNQIEKLTFDSFCVRKNFTLHNAGR